MQVDTEKLWDYHSKGLLRHSSHPSLPLHVWTYSQSAVYNRIWDEITTLCRGLVTDDEGQVIARPFPKFHNFEDPLTPAWNGEPFLAYEKMDGSLIIASMYEEQLIVNTKGSFITWHSEKAAEYLKGYQPLEGTTALFEFIDPLNRIVIDYQGFSGVVLLGAVDIETGQDDLTPDDYAVDSGWWGEVVRPYNLHLPNTLNTIKDPEAGENREGFVLVWPNPTGPALRAKIKFASYVHLHSVLTHLSNVSIWESLKLGTFEALLELIPDELYDQINLFASDLLDSVRSILNDHSVIVETAVTRYDNRKEQAAYILEYSDYSGIAFNLLDGKEYEASSKAWDAVRPYVSEAWTYLK